MLQQPTSKAERLAHDSAARQIRSGVRRFVSSSCPTLLALLLVLSSRPACLSAQTNAMRDLSSRYLFIVDKSAAMKRCASATQKAVENLLRSALNGQLQPGDSLGVWTFEE